MKEISGDDDEMIEWDGDVFYPPSFKAVIRSVGFDRLRVN
jgi:hypothetical protein